MTDTDRKRAAKAFAEYWKDRGDEKSDSQSFWLSLMSDEGTAFIEECIVNNKSCSHKTKKTKKMHGFSCYLLDETAEKELKNF